MSLNLYRMLQRRFEPAENAWTRREMLRATLAGAAGLLLCESGSASGAARRAGKRVVVIGAGFGGLSAAHELCAAGYDVTVVEARQRLGGRVLSIQDLVPGKTVETGGELIGANHPAWAKYAEHFGLKFIPLDQERGGEAPIVLNGRKLEAAEAKGLWEELRHTLSLINVDAADVNPHEPWTHPQARRLDCKSTASWLAGLNISELCKQAATVQLTAINGMLPAWQSYLANLAMIKGGGLEKYWTETDTLQCAGGNQQLAVKLAEAIGRERVRLGAPVKAVTIGEARALVVLENGVQLEADDVVLATPVSTWSRITFEPALPPELAGQMGMNVKFLAAVKERFWKQAMRSSRSLADGPICLTWEATNNQPGDEGACLCAYSGGPAVDQIQEWDRDERNGMYLNALEELFPGMRQNFREARFQNWPADPWSKGSYSFPAPGHVTLAGPILLEGIGRLHFAGEHVCAAFIGYMEGALHSGAALARRLAKRDGIAN